MPHAVYIVTFYDRGGLPVHAFGLCETHAPLDEYGAKAIVNLGSWRECDRNGTVKVRRATKDCWPCAKCEEAAETSAAEEHGSVR